jgi:antitoxin component of RelBE/YafQ-DinJ toxin-antitoxin module
MNITLSVDEKTVARARKRAEAMGTSLNQVIREYLQKLAGGDDAERWIEEFERLSGTGNSHGQRFNRDETHERS